MKFLKEFNDDLIVDSKVRITARAFVIDKFQKVTLLYYSGKFKGKRFSYYTTPGGGVEGSETLETAVKREVMEEIGFECNILHEVGVIVDYYCDQPIKTVTNYFIVEPTEKKRANWTDREKQYIKEVKRVDIDAAEQMLENMPQDSMGQRIQRRDLYALAEVKRILKL